MRFAALAAVGLSVLVCFNACGSSDGKKIRADHAGAGGDEGGAPPAGDAGSAQAGASPSGGTDNAAGTDNSGGTENSGDAGAGGTENSGSAGAGGDGNPPVIGPVSVDGVIVARNEQPVPGVTVEIQGQSVVTGVDGRFQIEAIAPYDIVVRGDPIGADTYIEAYLAVTRSDPKLYRSFVEEDRAGGAEGTVSGGLGFPQPVGHETRVTFGGPVTATFLNFLDASSDGTYDSSGDPTWLSTESLPGKLFAIQVQTATQTVTGIGSAPFTLVDAQTTPGGDVAMVSPAFHDFTLNLSAPDGLAIASASVSFGIGQTRANPGAQEVFSLPSGIPDEVGIGVTVYAGDATTGTAGAVYVLPGDATSLDVELPAPPSITSPPTPIVTLATPLSHTRPSATVAALNFSYEMGDVEVSYGTYITVFTDRSSITLQRLTDLDLGMPNDFAWSVGVQTGAATIDQLVAPDGDRWPLGPTSSSPRVQLSTGAPGPLPPLP